MSQLFLGYKFYQDAMKLILFLASVAFLGMAYSVYSYIRLKVGDLRRSGFKFYQDAIKFILFLASVGVFFRMAYSVYSYIRLKVGICIGFRLFCVKLCPGQLWYT